MSFNGLDENSPRIKQPKGLKIKLRPHQLTTITAMRELEKQSTIIIDKPDTASGLYQTLRYRVGDLDEFTNSTFVIGTNSAILADKVGSGKTYMIIALILEKLIPETHDKYIMGTDNFSIKMINTKEAVTVNLVVVPHNLANQWDDFMANAKLDYLGLNTVSDFDVFFDIDYVDQKDSDQTDGMVLYNPSRKKNIPNKKTTSGSKVAKPEIIYKRKKLNMEKVNNILNEKKVFILNIKRYHFFKQIFRSTKWARVIIDEMDSAPIPSVFSEFGNFNWFVTATPTSIFYKSCRGYVNKIFGYNKQLLDYFIVKNNDDYVDQSVVIPKPIVYMANSMLQRIVSVIRDLIPQDVMQLINSGNMKEAVAKLNCNVDTEENIVAVLTEKIRTDMHNFKTELKYLKNIIPPDEDAHEKKIKKIKQEIARCKIKLETVDERINSVKNECCFICAGAFDTPAILNCCKSVFCFKCLVASLKIANNKCPYCRHVITNNDEYHIISSRHKKNKIKKEKKTSKKFSEMDKTEVLEHILKYIAKNDEFPRILIFSDYSQTFEKIINNIAKAEMQFSLIAGVPAHINNVINDFDSGLINILLLDSRHYGSGLNLQSANYLILYHRMTPELETQVIGRAHRFGRTIPLKIIYLVNDAENKISSLSNDPIVINRKRDLDMIGNPPEQDGEEYEQFEESSEAATEEKPKKKHKNKSKKKSKRIRIDEED